ncbi:MAG: T9SS type A sorting domain-containing protein [Muribaculum sp.]|nr:T9SS type A sorting domain-containing protein [Muribaculum sp.]
MGTTIFKTILLVLSFCAVSHTYCQNRIVFDYEQQGNQIRRSIQIDVLSPPPITPFNKTSLFNDADVQIYPNPTNDILYVNLQLNDNDHGSIILNSISGSIVMEYDLGNSIALDLSGVQAGIYILTIHKNGTNQTYKVIRN